MAVIAPPTPPAFPSPTDSPEDFDDKAYDCFPYVESAANNVYANAQDAANSANSATSSASTASTAATTATTKASEASASAASALQSPGTNATSTTTFTPAYGANSFTLAQTGKNFVVGQFVTVADSTTPQSKYFNGAITAFDSGTGAITVNARDVVGAASGSSWVITAAAPSYGELFRSPVQNFVALGSVSGTVNIDLRAALKYSLTTSGNVTLTFTMPNIFTSATETWVVLDITKGGSHTITFPVGTLWSDGAQPTQNSSTRFEYLGTKAGSANWIFSAPRKNIA